MGFVDSCIPIMPIILQNIWVYPSLNDGPSINSVDGRLPSDYNLFMLICFYKPFVFNQPWIIWMTTLMVILTFFLPLRPDLDESGLRRPGDMLLVALKSACLGPGRGQKGPPFGSREGSENSSDSFGNERCVCV